MHPKTIRYIVQLMRKELKSIPVKSEEFDELLTALRDFQKSAAKLRKEELNVEIEQYSKGEKIKYEVTDEKNGFSLIKPIASGE